MVELVLLAAYLPEHLGAWPAHGRRSRRTGAERAARRQAAADAVTALPPERFPALAWVGPKLVAGSVDDRFEFGFACLLDGFAANLARRMARA